MSGSMVASVVWFLTDPKSMPVPFVVTAIRWPEGPARGSPIVTLESPEYGTIHLQQKRNQGTGRDNRVLYVRYVSSRGTEHILDFPVDPATWPANRIANAIADVVLKSNQ